ncbi:AAA family ATPase [Rheinheimera sp.]|uniref:AAA family ATPase n=1 Tax=Rheinheimera sp. TaxID=1869214 RepID=UPI00307EE1B3
MKLHEDLAQCVSAGLKIFDDVAQRQFGDLSVTARKVQRTWGLLQTAELAGVSHTAIINAEKEGKLPYPQMTALGRRVGYTIYEIDRIRQHFKSYPGKGGDICPVISLTGGKGGSKKTSTAVHLAQTMAIRGYKTLLVDIDQQGHASMYMGYIPNKDISDDETVLPWMLGKAQDLRYAIKPTVWPGLDVIPASLGLQRLEREMPDADLPFDDHMMLRAGLETVMADYDCIFVDCHPDLGLATINVMAASDLIMVTTPTALYDFMSSIQFMGAASDLFRELDMDDYEPVVKILLTMVVQREASQNIVAKLRDGYGARVMESEVLETDEVRKGQEKMRTIFEQSKDERSSPATHKRAATMYESLADEIMALTGI